jgi:hypothetical protein
MTLPIELIRYIERLGRQGRIYFIVAGPFVKIGWTTTPPDVRRDALQAGCPFPMRVVASHPAERYIERDLHLRFSCYRTAGGVEWFHLEGEMLDYVEHLIAGGVPMWHPGGPEYNPPPPVDETDDEDESVDLADIPF